MGVDLDRDLLEIAGSKLPRSIRAEHDRARKGRVARIREVVARGANIDAKEPSGDGRTALTIAAEIGDIDAFRALVALGADTRTRSFGGSTIAHVAADRHDPAVLIAAIEAGCPIDVADDEGQLPIHRWALGEGVRAIELLVAHGADPRANDAAGRTPLHMAAEADNAPVAALLIAHGADPDAADHAGESALDVATRERAMKVLAVLEEATKHPKRL